MSDSSIDTRNVVDKYRNWPNDDIKKDLDKTRFQLEIAIENLEHDFNIGSIVRTANAFNVRAIHIVGRRQWNKRGAMVTNRYMHILHHLTVKDFKKNCLDKMIIGVDNLANSIDLGSAQLPGNALLVFGAEGPGLSPAMQEICQQMVAIEQFGSTRSINVGAAAAIAMYAWLQQNVL